jgi:sec-independent protein translocase protein TatA
MPRLGLGEIIVVLVLALLFFGPSKLPQLGSSLGEAIKGFKKGLGGLGDDKPAAQNGAETTTTPATPPTKAPPPTA